VCFVLGPCLSWGRSGSGVLYADGRAAHWVRCAASGRGCFHPHRRAEPSTVIRDRTFSESSSRADTPLQSSFTHSPAPKLSLRSIPAWVSSLIATSPVASTTRSKHPASAKFRPQVFSTSRRLTPPLTVRASFIPVPRPGFAPVQGVLSPCSYLPSSRRITSMQVHAPSAHRLSPAATAAHACFEASFHTEQRSHLRAV
jgi:hypothetical protein